MNIYSGDIHSITGIKNVFELEGIINSMDCCFKFLNRSVPIYPENEIVLKPDEQKSRPHLQMKFQ